jgi:potassium/hydrogen antiporter
MPTSEPFGTALLLTTAGALMAASVLFSRASQRIGVPIALLFLLIGMLAGSEGIGGIAFEDYGFAFRLGSLALALILFDGGLNTPLAALRRTWAPATVLATVGVVLTALAIAVPAHWWGLDWAQALVLGAVVSSTDAASVFAVLRGSGLQLKRQVGTTLELESGLNDPVAVILTVTLSGALVTSARGALEPGRIALEIGIQLAVGTALGVGVGLGGRELLRRNPLQSGGLYSALSLALALLAYGVTTLLHGSGFLAVYLAGMILGNAPLPYHAGLLRVHDALA